MDQRPAPDGLPRPQQRQAPDEGAGGDTRSRAGPDAVAKAPPGDDESIDASSPVTRAAAAVADMALVLMGAIIVVEVLLRQLFGRSMMVADELSAYLLLVTTFLGFGVAFQDGRLFRLEAVLGRLRGRCRYLLELMLGLVAFACAATIAAYLLQYALDSARRGLVSDSALQMPLWVPQAAMFGGVLLLAWVALQRVMTHRRER